MHKIWGIDILRGVAALLVLCFHFWTFFPEASLFQSEIFLTLFSAGHLGVDMFFVLSGFLVTLSLWYSRNFWHYFSKRLRRIVPLAWAVILIIFLYKREFFPENFLDLFVHLSFLQSFFPDFYHSINPVLWTLSVEMLFYITLPFLFLGVARKNFQLFFLISFFLVLLGFVWRAYIFYAFGESSAQEKIFLSEQLWGRFDQFFLGMILAGVVYCEHTKNFWKFFSRPFIQNFCLILGAGIFFSSYILFAHWGSSFRDTLTGQMFLHSAVGLGFFLLLFWFIHQKFSQTTQKFWKPFLFLGEISYGIYVFHFPILSLCAKILFFHQHPEISLLIAFCTTILVAWISYQFFEKLFVRKK